MGDTADRESFVRRLGLRMPWGKYRAPEQGGPACLSLIDHSADVAAMFEALLVLPQFRARLERAAGRKLDRRDVARLCVLAFLHDFGKCASGFQRKSLEPGNGTGHMKAASILFANDPLASRVAEALELSAMLAWGSQETVCGLLLAALAHHGRPLALREGSPGEQRRIAAAWRP